MGRIVVLRPVTRKTAHHPQMREHGVIHANFQEKRAFALMDTAQTAIVNIAIEI
jgi:hypothetical protein